MKSVVSINDEKHFSLESGKRLKINLFPEVPAYFKMKVLGMPMPIKMQIQLAQG